MDCLGVRLGGWKEVGVECEGSDLERVWESEEGLCLELMRLPMVVLGAGFSLEEGLS